MFKAHFYGLIGDSAWFRKYQLFAPSLVALTNHLSFHLFGTGAKNRPVFFIMLCHFGVIELIEFWSLDSPPTCQLRRGTIERPSAWSLCRESCDIMAGQCTPLRKKGLIRPSQGKPMVNKPLIRPYFWGIYVARRGGPVAIMIWWNSFFFRKWKKFLLNPLVTGFVFCFLCCFTSLQICLLNIFGNYPPQMVPMDLNIGNSRVWRLDSGPNLQPCFTFYHGFEHHHRKKSPFCQGPDYVCNFFT